MKHRAGVIAARLLWLAAICGFAAVLLGAMIDGAHPVHVAWALLLPCVWAGMRLAEEERTSA